MAGTSAYKNNWAKEKLDRINLTVPKGEKDPIQSHAAAHGESITAFIQRAIRETMEHDTFFDKSKDELLEMAKKYDVPIEDFPPVLTVTAGFFKRSPAVTNA